MTWVLVVGALGVTVGGAGVAVRVAEGVAILDSGDWILVAGSERKGERRDHKDRIVRERNWLKREKKFTENI